MNILDHVHDISPTLQRYDQEYSNPGQAYVVKRDNSMEWITWSYTEQIFNNLTPDSIRILEEHHLQLV